MLVLWSFLNELDMRAVQSCETPSLSDQGHDWRRPLLVQALECQPY